MPNRKPQVQTPMEIEAMSGNPTLDRHGDYLGLPLDLVQDGCAELRQETPFPRGSEVLLTGASGTIGRWILAILWRLVEAGELPEVGLTVLGRGRTTKNFPSRWPSELSVIETDIRGPIRFDVPPTHIIHAATPATIRTGANNAELVAETGVMGAIRLAEALLGSGPGAEAFVNLSSGAVYGTPPEGTTEIKEGDTFPYETQGNARAYAHTKALAEELLSDLLAPAGISVTHARIFAVMGPGMELPGNLAISNFVHQATRTGKVRVAGSGRPIRSYLPLHQVAVLLIKLAGRTGNKRIVNVGSPNGRPLAEWAELVAAASGSSLEIANGVDPPGRDVYVPSVEGLHELGFAAEDLDVERYLTRWCNWQREQS